MEVQRSQEIWRGESINRIAEHLKVLVFFIRGWSYAFREWGHNLSLLQYVEYLHRDNFGVTITLVVEGMELYFSERGIKALCFGLV